MARREAGNRGDRNRYEQQRQGLEGERDCDDREAECSREAQSDTVRTVLGVGEAVTLRLEVALEPGLHG
jgi:hypothetical protein